MNPSLYFLKWRLVPRLVPRCCLWYPTSQTITGLPVYCRLFRSARFAQKGTCLDWGTRPVSFWTLCWLLAAPAFADEALYSVSWTWSFTVSIKSIRLGRLSSMNVRSMGLLKAAHNWANTSSHMHLGIEKTTMGRGWTNTTRPLGDAHLSLIPQGQFFRTVCMLYVHSG